MVDEKKMDQLFSKLTEVTQIQDVGYHEIKDGKLNPIYKTRTEDLDIAKWKETHAQNIVYIKDNPILIEVIESKRPVTISNTKQDPKSSGVFFLFGIDSIMVIPVIKQEVVNGIVVIASIGKLHDFTEDEVSRCEALVKEWMN